MTYCIIADWVLPVSRPPIKNGAVLVKDGRISAVGSADDPPFADLTGIPRLHLPYSLLMAGIVNPHTHLDNSLCPHLSQVYRGFYYWIGRMAEFVRNETEGSTQRAIEIGAQLSLKAGVTAVGDISRSGSSATILPAWGLRGIVFGELICLSERESVDHLSFLENWLALPSLGVAKGLAPHSPYTVLPEMLKKAVLIARKTGCLISLHLGESPFERSFFHDQEVVPEVVRPIVSLLPKGVTPVQYAGEVGLLSHPCLLVHCIVLTETDLPRLADSKAWIVHCPRSNQNLKVGQIPLSQLLNAGGRVCVGTDGLASVPSLDPKEEVAFAIQLGQMRRREYASLEPDQWLSLITLQPARALRLGHKIGSLDPGKDADCALFISPEPTSDPYEFLFRRLDASVVFIQGRPRWVDPTVQEACSRFFSLVEGHPLFPSSPKKKEMKAEALPA